MMRLHSVRHRVLAVCLCIPILLFATPVHAQEGTLSIDQRVQQAKHGPDGAGKDGPMAKVSSELIRLHYEAKSGRLKAKASEERKSPLQVGNGYVTVDALAVESGERLRDELEALGLRNAAVAGRLVSGRLPIEALDEAAALGSMRTIQGAAGGTGVGDVTSQGDVSMQTDQVRSNLGVDGSGVKVCVLSDSYNTSSSASTSASDDVQSGDLPGTSNPNGYTKEVDIPSGGDKYAGLDEGRAMLQIVHDIAPGAELGFHSTVGGRANYANAITELSDPGQGNCDVVVDDYIYFAEGMLQDGQVAQSVKEAVNEDGVIYVSFAGNAGDRSYESKFRRSGQEISSLACCSNKSGEMHDFDSGSGTDVRQQITISDGASPNLSLQWSDPYLDGKSDLDLYLIDAAADTIAASSEGDNVNSFVPETIFTYTNPTNSPKTYEIVVTLTDNGADEAPDLIKWVDVLSSFGRLTIDEYDTNSGTSFGHRNVSEAITVGAAAWFNTPDVPSGSNVTPDDPPVLNEFSSKGGVPIYFKEDGTRLPSPEFRSKPDVTAPDGGENTFFGSDGDNDGFPSFYGTSAAAPHAAGVVALMLDEAGGGDALSGSEVKTRLQDSALDIVERSGPFLGAEAADKTSIPNGTGDDIFSGAGLVQADAAAPLPVDLVAFDGRMDGDEAVLSWKTASERQNSGFAVQQRSRSGSFQEIGFVEGNGTTSTTQRYRFRTGALDPGRHLFRLKQIDADGTVEYTDSIAVRRRMSGAYQLSRIAPNPAKKRAALTLTVKERQEVHAAAYNALGQRVTVLYNGKLGAKEETTLRLSDGSFASGVYFVRVEGETFSATRKVVWVQ